MCEALGVSRGGFYAWLARPRSCRSLSDEVIGAQVRHSFVASDRTYGARRVWRDVLEMGHNCGLHRIERLMREQALRARPKRRGLPKDRGERSVVADNVLERQFHADAPNQKWVADFTYIRTAEGWLYVAEVLDLYSRRIVLVYATQHDLATGGRCTDDGCVAAGRARGPAAPFGPSHSIPAAAKRARYHLQHEPCGRGVGQLGHGELLQLAQDGAHSQEGLPVAGAGPFGCVRLHRALLQPHAPTFSTGLSQSDTVRGSSKSLGRCQPNRQQPKTLKYDLSFLNTTASIAHSAS